jgi:hypothetical protein
MKEERSIKDTKVRTKRKGQKRNKKENRKIL